MLHSQGLLLHLLPASTQGLLSHWVHSGANSQVETLHQRVLKLPQFPTWFLLGLQSYGGCSPDWDSGWPGEDSQGRGTSQYMATQFERKNSKAFTHFYPHSCQSARRSGHTPQGPALGCFPSMIPVSSKAVSSQLCLCPDTALPPCAGVGPVTPSTLPDKASTNPGHPVGC